MNDSDEEFTDYENEQSLLDSSIPTHYAASCFTHIGMSLEKS